MTNANIYTTNCKRCGKKITTMSQPIYTSNSTMKKYQGICSGCMTDKEEREMMFAMNRDIQRKLAQ